MKFSSTLPDRGTREPVARSSQEDHPHETRVMFRFLIKKETRSHRVDSQIQQGLNDGVVTQDTETKRLCNQETSVQGTDFLCNILQHSIFRK